LELIALRQRQGFSTWRFTVMSTMGSLPVAEFSLRLDLPLCTDHQCKLYRQGIVASDPARLC
jgi:hypothetical protein